MFTKNFKELGKNDALIAGGKGASLGEMLNAGISVPPGFVVLAGAFEKFLEMTDLNVEIDATLETVDNQKMHTVEKASEKIQALILQSKMPEDIAREIEKEFKMLDAKFVAVRSSATAEDGAEAAWAGQLNSYLNTTQESLLQNVQKCWASLFTPRAIFYRFEKYHPQSSSPVLGESLPAGRQGVRGEGYGGDEKISVAVVVQKMIQSEKSGIAFSVHPVTEDYNQLIIEAGYGLGEAIVSGSVTPDSYVVDKIGIMNYELRIKNEELGIENKELGTENAIIDVNVSTQTKALFGKDGGGNEWKELGEKGEEQVLDEKEILELSDLIIKIENHYNFPCDIEWAYESEKFYITQSRPITTLRKINEAEKQEIGAVFSRPFSLLRMQFLSRGECDGIKRLTNSKAYFNPIFVYSPDKGMTAYYNLSVENEGLPAIFEQLNGNIEVVKKELKIAQEACAFLEAVTESGRIDSPKDVVDRIFLPQPFSSLGNIVGRVSFATEELLEILKSFRYDYDGLIYKLEKLLLKEGKNNVDKKLKDDVTILSFEELFEGKEPIDLEKRRKGFIYYEGKIIIKSLDDFLEEHNFYIKKDESVSKSEGEIEGNSAYKGIATGTVKKIYVEKDFEKFNDGDVLVAAMTIPDFIPVMKKAVAFVTDEGGITCHAAIIAREMKKPCIIGTKIATQVLKDGDLVEVDANEGIVRIIKKEEKEKSLNNVKLDDYNYVSNREISLLEMTLIIESYRSQYGKIKYLQEFGKLLSDQTIIIGNGSSVDMYRTKKSIEDAGRCAINLIKNDKSLLKKLSKLSVEIANAVDIKCKMLEKEIKSKNISRERLYEFYKEWRLLFLEFFPMQVLPLGFERSLEFSEKNILMNNQDTLVKWRDKTQKTQMRLEKLFSIFLKKSYDFLDKDLRYYSDNEIIKYLEQSVAVDDEEIKSREKSYVMIWSFEQDIPYAIYSGVKINRTIFHLENKNLKKEINDSILIGRGIGKGSCKSSVFIMKKKSDLNKLPLGCIVVAKVLELEDIHKLINKKIGGVIVEEGGITSHIAISGRELNVPIVAGVRNVTRVLKDGDLVEVDANVGVVRILEK